MGTWVEIRLYDPDERKAAADTADAFAEMARLDELLGGYEQRGAVHELNRSGSPDGVILPAEVFDLLQRARRVGADTAGAFDITVGSLMRLWSFETGGKVPSREALARALPLVGWDRLRFDPAARRVTFTRPGVAIDLGGIGEGYAVDRVHDLLAGRGHRAGLINAGGDMRVWGRKPDGGLWTIGLQHPRGKDALLGTLTLTDRAVVTSGDYEKTFTEAGRDWHHILDPSTGYPSTGLASVTVVGPTAEYADACSTALMVLGPSGARRFLDRHAEIQAVLVDDKGGVFISPELADAWRPAL
jgi:thiamine biosynthesis lipoprotein